ncbi:MAG: (S)-benzoin forming benzil reductase [Lentimicrobiaceae bacterium]|nr:(S)-benzoin forming benzil reductase [Lentimicrobiaceae bacterium]
MKYYIVTGTSSGIGEAIANKLIQEKHKVFCISRRINNRLTQLASNLHTGLWYYQLNLADSQEIVHKMREIFTFIDPEIATGIALINNAGVVSPVAPSGKLDTYFLENHIKVNLTAPMILANEFIRRASPLKIEKTIVNISSGAAQNPYPGWSAYCSSKAGLDMLTRTIAVEQQRETWPVRIFSVAPGVVDTPMQKTLRQTSEDDFPPLERFIQLHKSGKLSQPDDVAEKIISLTFGSSPASGDIIDLRTF